MSIHVVHEQIVHLESQLESYGFDMNMFVWDSLMDISYRLHKLDRIELLIEKGDK